MGKIICRALEVEINPVPTPTVDTPHVSVAFIVLQNSRFLAQKGAGAKICWPVWRGVLGDGAWVLGVRVRMKSIFTVTNSLSRFYIH